jgi:polar amino acid transport system substrate-binding protein
MPTTVRVRMSLRHGRRLIAAIIGVVALIALAACSSGSGSSASAGNTNGSSASASGGTLAALQKAGTVKVGFADFAPYSFQDSNGNATGSEFQVLKVILQKMGISNIQPISVDVAGLIPGLQAHRYDMVVSLLDITAARCAQVIYANPYEGALESFAVKKGNPLHISDFASIAANPNIRVAYLQGGAEIQYFQDAKVASSQIHTYPSILDGLAALQAGRIDAFVGDSVGIGYPMASGAYPTEQPTTPFAPTLKGKTALSFPAIALRPDEKDVQAALNTQIAALQQNIPQLTAIGKPFGFSAANYTIAKGRTAQEVCQQGD